MNTSVHLWSYLAPLFLTSELFLTKFVGKMKTHISRSITFFFQSRAVYEIMWKNILEPGRPQMIIGRMRIEYRIIKL